MLKGIKQHQPQNPQNDAYWWLSETVRFVYEELFRVGNSRVPRKRGVYSVRQVKRAPVKGVSREIIIETTTFYWVSDNNAQNTILNTNFDIFIKIKS
jgi:hypothetical protein